MSNNIFNEHKIVLTNRKEMTISGVIKVISYDETVINLKTDYGKMIIQGENLTAGQLNTKEGRLVLTGEVVNIQYRQNKFKDKSFKGLIFK